MNTDPWYSAYHYSHPPLVERLAALDDSDKKADWEARNLLGMKGGSKEKTLLCNYYGLEKWDS